MSTRPSVLTVADLISGLTGDKPAHSVQPDTGSARIERAVVDSRLATPGSLFVALQGEHHDGHDFVVAAIESGAVAVIAEKPPPPGVCSTLVDLGSGGTVITGSGLPVCLLVPNSLEALQRVAAHWRRQHDVRVIGITGSVGKTTSKEVTAAVLGKRYRTLRTMGNYNNEIGLPLTLLHLTGTHQCIVLEMGMYEIGEIAQLTGIALPQVGVVTNVGPAHLERLGTIERIAQAKAELPNALPSEAEGGVAILNADDGRVVAMAGQTRARVFTYGLDPSADVWADDIESEGLDGIRFRLHHARDTIHARVPMLGRHSVHTALCATSVGLVERLSWAEIVAGLRDQSVQLRLVAVPGPHGSTILDDSYNASPASSIAALNLLDELPGRKLAVLGDMYELGSYEEEGHRIVGRRTRDVVDLLIAVGSLSRIIAEEAIGAGMASESVHLAATNSEAVQLLRTLLESGDVLLVKGSRGAQMEEIVAALAQPVLAGESGAGEVAW
jgi:UDP-N-acetylmuramoyl-tripeptide--D-alanyl-D-alanine ligase